MKNNYIYVEERPCDMFEILENNNIFIEDFLPIKKYYIRTTPEIDVTLEREHFPSQTCYEQTNKKTSFHSYSQSNYNF